MRGCNLSSVTGLVGLLWGSERKVGECHALQRPLVSNSRLFRMRAMNLKKNRKKVKFTNI
jgi:hypothetical protein